MSDKPRWRFPKAEGVIVNEETGEWADGSAALFGDEEEEQQPLRWYPAEPAEHVTDVAAWARWLTFLTTHPEAGRIVRQAALADAHHSLRRLRRRKR